MLASAHLDKVSFKYLTVSVPQARCLRSQRIIKNEFFLHWHDLYWKACYFWWEAVQFQNQVNVSGKGYCTELKSDGNEAAQEKWVSRIIGSLVRLTGGLKLTFFWGGAGIFSPVSHRPLDMYALELNSERNTLLTWANASDSPSGNEWRNENEILLGNLISKHIYESIVEGASPCPASPGNRWSAFCHERLVCIF